MPSQNLRLSPRFPADSFRSKAEFDNYLAETREWFDALYRQQLGRATNELEIASHGTCGPCMRPSTFVSDVVGGEKLEDGRVVPNWREQAKCDCADQLSARLRATLHFLQSVTGVSQRTKLLVFGPPSMLDRRCERVMPTTRFVSQLSIDDGIYRLPEPTGSASVVVALDVLHTVPPLDEALSEIHRVLGSGGQLVFTVPFRLFTERTVSHLTTLPRTNGLLPVERAHEVHELGWDILDRLRAAGFRQSTAHSYRSEELGYFGLFNMIFSANA
jgi:SAM-dependent methyltransferase